MNKTFILLSILSICLYGCDQKSSETYNTITLTNFEQIKLDRLLQASQYIPLEYSKESTLPSGHIIYSDHGLFYSGGRTNTVVYRFDTLGHFINTIGSIGNGPGEYSSRSDVVITDKEVIFWTKPKTNLIHYDFNGKFIKSETILEDDCASFAWHPRTGDYYVYTPLLNNLIYQIDPLSFIRKDSAFPNRNKSSATLPCIYRTFEGTLLFKDPLDLRMNIYEFDDIIKLKYSLDYGKNYGSYDRNDPDSRSTTLEESETWDLRVLLENSDWLYMCLQVLTKRYGDLKDINHLIYNKNNTLSILINPHQVADNSNWMDDFAKKGIHFNVDGNPIVVKINIDQMTN